MGLLGDVNENGLGNKGVDIQPTCLFEVMTAQLEASR